MRKRGMVSVFIIVGLFILIVIALGYSLYQGLIPGLTTPRELQPIKTYTEACIREIGQDAVGMMMLQGGYIELPLQLSTMDASIDLGYRVPYWLHRGVNWRPSPAQMEAELAQHIETHLDSCLNAYQPFLNRYRISMAGERSVSVAIKESEIRVMIYSPLKVETLNGDKQMHIDEFRQNVPTSLGRLYSLAAELMDYENSQGFLEDYTDEMIASSDYLPYEGMDISCSPWLERVEDLKEYTQTLVMHNLNFLQFLNTQYRETGLPYYDKLYKIDFTGNNYREIDVKVIYNPEWGMDFEVTPSENGLTRPHEFRISKYLLTCVKVFHHKYTLEYPVLFRLANRDEQFFFASPVIMRRGEPNRYQEVSPWPTDYDRLGSRQYCAETSEVTKYGVDATGMMTATPSIRSNRRSTLEVYAKDSYTGQILPGVNISYQCVVFLCPMGTTEYPMQGGLLTGGYPWLVARFPDCSGGLLIAEKQGYHTAREQVTVSAETDGSQVTVELHPLKQFNYLFKVVQDRNGIVTVRDLEEGEQVMLTLKNNEQMFEQNVIFPTEDDYMSELYLLVGDFTYDLDIKLVNDINYLGGLKLNWTMPASKAIANRHAIFYILKKDPAYTPTKPEDFKALYDYAMDNSGGYLPELR